MRKRTKKKEYDEDKKTDKYEEEDENEATEDD